MTSRNLKRRLKLLTCIGIVSLMSLVPASVSSHSQGLHWGFQEGDVFYFNYSWETSLRSNEYSYSATALEQPEITDPLVAGVNWFPRSKFQLSRNVTFGPGAVPIGNWSLLSAIARGGGNDVFETDTTWGFGTVGADYGDYKETQLRIFSKNDGVQVNSTYVVTYDNGYQEKAITLRVDPLLAPLLFTAVGISVIVLIVIWKKNYIRR